MTKDEQQEEKQEQGKTDQSRRDFLRKSKYAAYAAPLMTSLVISQNAAATSDTGPPGIPGPGF
ncbi:hypothetical protein [sulfur-oxidizing endosymbiont of Gigantopelta aegis]|uniref:hypothetical protein n=1 Tax=sulfur-oxidizing endosymbiont of Gigantopelta aegis TaxID=2794934 RepID=UPI0018DC4876|nr:hypothetical protein [sulfur-oxidizing endosymbiont of Gigantopelta aegis]